MTTGAGKLIVGGEIHASVDTVGAQPTITGNVDLNGGQPLIIGGFESSAHLVIDGVISNGGVTFGENVNDHVILRGAANTYEARPDRLKPGLRTF